MSAVATLAPDLFDLTRIALDELSEQQRRVYELTHGIDADGQTDAGEMELQQVADHIGVSRGAARWHLAQAERTVYRAIAMHLYSAEVERLDAAAMPDPGNSEWDQGNGSALPKTIDYSVGGDGLTIRGTRAGTGGTILGPGSERHVREAKRSAAKGRTAALITAHQECVVVLA